MKKLFLLAVLTAFAVPAFAQTNKPLLDPSRLGLGLAAFREWNVDANFNTVSAPDWRVAVPVAWELTSTADPAVKHPVSLIGSADFGLSSQTWRFKAGIELGLKESGK